MHSIESHQRDQLAESFIGRPATREVVPRDPRESTRWHRHDYPSPIARWNFHPEYEVHLITRGSGRYLVGDRVGSFSAGHLALIGPNLPHDWISDLSAGEKIADRDVVMQFRDDWIRSCIDLLPELSELESLLDAASRGIEFFGESAARGTAQLEAIGALSGAAKVSGTFALLTTLARAPRHERRYFVDQWIPAVGDARTSDVVSSALEYILENLAGEVRLGEAARRVGMSETSFSRCFRRWSGSNFSDIVRRLRLAHACKLLDETDDAVAGIALAVGYRNLSNFNRQFRSELGCAPSRYRTRTARS